MLRFHVISGSIPVTLEEVMNFNFTLPTTPSNGTGILFYTLNTREGYQGYRIEINGQGGNPISLPSGSHFATLHTVVEPLRQNNTLQFKSIGTAGASRLEISQVIVFYED
jgi:hypothetical protein